jgi:hypothetical protein
VFVVRPIFAWHYRYDNLYQSIGFTPTPWDKAQVLICTNLGLVVFLAVSLRFFADRLEFRQDATDLAERRTLLPRFWLLAVPLGALAAWSLYWQWDFLATGAAMRIIDPKSGATALVAGNGYLIGAGMMLAPITAMIAFLARFKWWSLLPFLAFAVLKLGTGGRADFVAAAVMIAILYLFDKKRRWPSLVVIVGALAVVTVFDSLKENRGAIIRETFRPGIEDHGFQHHVERAPLESMDIASMEFFEYLVWAVPERTGSYDYFLNNLQAVTEPIPRALWPGKPIGPPIKLFDLYDGTNPVGITYSVPGMGWYSAGYLGVAVWCAFFALLYGLGYRWLARGRQSNLALITYAIFLATAPIAFRDGSLVAILRQLMFYWVPVAGLAVLVRFGSLSALKRKPSTG